MPVEGNTTVQGPYATAARLYRAAGWGGVLPVGRRAGEKWPPPHGWTGHGAAYPTGSDTEAWIETHGDRNVGLRMPQGVIGLDVDAYEKDGKLKGGGEALAELEARLGALPPTWVSGARPAPSGIRFYRVPLEIDGREINWPGEAAKGIEIIQAGHRYAVVWPSTNPEAAGATYGWRHDGTGHGTEEVGVPHPDELPELPEAWVRGLMLSYERTEKSTLDGGTLAAWWELLRPNPACDRVTAALGAARTRLADAAAGRHETARDSARTLAAYGGEGHAGAGEALLLLGEAFIAAVSGPGRDAEGEWLRLLSGAVELAATDNPSPRSLCPCVPPVVLAPPPPAVDAAPFHVPPPDEPVESDALTDARLVDSLHDELLAGRYVWSNGFGWLSWDGVRWRECSDETVVEDVRLWAVRYVERQVSNVYVAASREARGLLIGLLSKYRLYALTDLARGLCQVDQAAFDAHPHLLNTPSGIVDLRTGELGPHDPALRFTRVTSVRFRPGAEHADWLAALGALPEDVVAWLQVRFGQSITGHMTPDDLLLLLRGGGENGKSTILNAVKGAIGDYGTYVSDRVLLADPGSHPTELMDFRGARFALTEELPDEARLNVKRLKDVVGTPVMKARRMRKDPVEFAATHSLFLSTNHVPVVTDTDHGTWRRLALVEFPYRFRKAHEPLEGPEDRRGDEGLRDRLLGGEAQREAVLAWLVAGAVRWYADGMPPAPASVDAATQAWREKSDPIEGFWAEHLRADPTSFIASADMTRAFNDYLVSIGQKPWSDRRIIPALADHVATKRNGVRYARVRVPAGVTRSYRVGLGAAPLSPFVPSPVAEGSQVRAWWGVRFVTQTELDLQ